MLAINGKVTEQTTSIKFLGILLDEYYWWKNHISVVENEISKNIGILHKANNIFSKSGFKNYIFFSYIVTWIMGKLPGEAPLEQNWKNSQAIKDRLLK